jgi:hypothetical protein
MTPNQWTRSSFCANGACIDVMWTRSSACTGGACVETRTDGASVHVRDGKNPDGPVLTFDPAAWRAFIDAVKGAGP